jgi:serine/threonine-protein kinase
MDTDHNLLFGVLALQADFLTHAQFVEACTLWANRKDQPLADLLVERGWLSPGDRADVERLVARKLNRHGGDLRASLAAVTIDDVRDSLAAVADSDVRASLAGLSAAGRPAIVATVDFRPASRDRYRLSRLHAQGGIGQVWLARDESIGRDVALKELQPDRGGPEVCARFVAEARVTGQLEHPGIVPVYELGSRPEDRQPFYTMRFLHGRTLTAAAESYHRRRAAGEASRLDLRGLVEAVVAACNAVGYAHSRGVIHRDLKGSNIILGDFGEVVVLDWGLAKVLDRETPRQADRETDTDPVSLSPTADSPDEGQTVAGQLLGTPAYMAPEQADGRNDQVDFRTDVYGLGAVLYEVLTGRPPFAGARTEEVLDRVRHEPPERPRRLVPGTPAALDAVCLKALSKDPAARYPTALALADDLRHWLADEPVSCHREPLSTRLTRWGRRHKTLAVGLATLLVVGLAAAATVAWQVDRARRRVEAEQDRTEAARAEAVANHSRALDAVELMLTRVGSEELANIPLLEGVRRRLLEDALRFYEVSFEDHAADPEVRLRTARAHQLVGDLHTSLANFPDAHVHYARAGTLLDGLESDGHTTPRWRQTRLRLLWGVGHLANLEDRHADAEATYRRMLDLLAREPAAGSGRSLEADARKGLAEALFFSGRYAESLATFDGAIRLLEELVRATPADAYRRYQLAGAQHNRAEALSRLGRFAEAEKGFRQALRTEQPLIDRAAAFPAYRRDRASTLFRLGAVLGYQGRPGDGEGYVRKAIDIFTRLVGEFPSIASYRVQLAAAQHELGNLLSGQGKLPEAERAYRESLAHMKELLADGRDLPTYRADQANTHMRLSQVLNFQGKLPEAEQALREARGAYGRLVKDAPTVPKYRTQLAATQHNLGELLVVRGRLAEAEQCFRESQATLAAAPKADRAMPFNRADVANTWMALGNLYKRQKRYADAEAALVKARDLFAALAADTPRQARYRGQHAAACHNLASVHRRLGRPADAEAGYRKSRELARQIVREFPNLMSVQLDLANTCQTLAHLLHGRGADAEAFALLDESQTILGDLQDRRPGMASLPRRVQRCKVLRLLWRGDDTAAARVAEKLAGTADKRHGDGYEAACLFALCLETVAKDRKLDDVERAKRTKAYRERALGLLRDALRKGEVTPMEAEDDADFGAFRTDPGFKEVLQGAQPGRGTGPGR